MTDQEAFGAWFKDRYDSSHENKEMYCAGSQNIAWSAALAWLRSQGEPVAWISPNGLTASTQKMLNGTPLFLTPQPAIPDGYRLVPEEPTAEMLKAAVMERHGMATYRANSSAACRDLEDEVASDYRAILAAAPEPRK